MSRLRSQGPADGDRRRGQGLVEYAITIPIFMLILLGMLEFGFAFAHNLTLEYATREGARTGAALAAGSDAFPCNDGTGISPVDTAIMAAVQRVLTSPGSQVDMSKLGNVTIYKADTSGLPVGTSINTWVWDGSAVKFKQVTRNWDACARLNAATPDHLGVSLTYGYRYITPLGSLMGLAGTPTMNMSDRTVMALNPTN